MAIIENNLINIYKPLLNVRKAISNYRDIKRDYQHEKYINRRFIKDLMNVEF
jgi:hypothetical protein